MLKSNTNNNRNTLTTTINDELAGIFKILALLINTQNVNNINNILSKLSSIVFKTKLLHDAHYCILESNKYFSHKPANRLFHHVGEQLLLLGLKVYRVHNGIPSFHNNNNNNVSNNNYVMFWLEQIRNNDELINEILNLLLRLWNSKSNHTTCSNNLFSSNETTYKQRCLQDCIYLFKR